MARAHELQHLLADAPSDAEAGELTTDHTHHLPQRRFHRVDALAAGAGAILVLLVGTAAFGRRAGASVETFAADGAVQFWGVDVGGMLQSAKDAASGTGSEQDAASDPSAAPGQAKVEAVSAAGDAQDAAGEQMPSLKEKLKDKVKTAIARAKAGAAATAGGAQGAASEQMHMNQAGAAAAAAGAQGAAIGQMHSMQGKLKVALMKEMHSMKEAGAAATAGGEKLKGAASEPFAGLHILPKGGEASEQMQGMKEKLKDGLNITAFKQASDAASDPSAALEKAKAGARAAVGGAQGAAVEQMHGMKEQAKEQVSGAIESAKDATALS